MSVEKKNTTKRTDKRSFEERLTSEEFLEDNGTKLLFDEIDSDQAKEVISWIIKENIQKKHSYLTLIINSDGGDLYHGFAIADVIADSKIPVRAQGIGTVGSSALVIFMSCEKGHRVLTKKTSILSHQWSSETDGKSHELKAAHRELELTDERMLEHYKKHTKLNGSLIKRKLLPQSDVFLSAEEALELGICDKIKDL